MRCRRTRLRCDLRKQLQKKGNPFVGTTFTSSVTHPDLTVASAIGQMRVIAKNANMDVLSEDVEGGSMLIEEPESLAHKPIPMIISATSEGGQGTVGMVVKVNKGAIASADGVREMCKLLNQVKPGKAGEQAPKATPQASVVTIAADRFGFQLRNQNKDNPAAIEPRYKGQDLRHHRSHHHRAAQWRHLQHQLRPAQRWQHRL